MAEAIVQFERIKSQLLTVTLVLALAPQTQPILERNEIWNQWITVSVLHLIRHILKKQNRVDYLFGHRLSLRLFGR